MFWLSVGSSCKLIYICLREESKRRCFFKNEGEGAWSLGLGCLCRRERLCEHYAEPATDVNLNVNENASNPFSPGSSF